MICHDWTIKHSLRVLVVDNQENTADAVVWLVRRWGHTGYSASTSAAALQIVAARKPDVVLLDMEMPLVDGHQLAKHLRCNFPESDCFIVACTQQVDDALRRQYTRSGIDLLLMKPVDSAVLEILLLLECELVNRSRSDKDPATKASAKSRWSPKTNGRDSAGSSRRTGGSPC